MDPVDPPPSSRLTRRPEERVGTVLPGGWTLEAPIGSGGMATVFRARGTRGEAVAIKLLHPQVAEDDEACKRFAFEVRAANGLEHPGAVTVLDAGLSDDGLPFMVMELLEGVTLSSRLARGPAIAVDELLEVADALLDVLAAAHARGIIHRDVKPANVFLAFDGTTKLLDFGIAKLQSVQRSLQTAPGSTLGTLGYMAPEQVHGRADARSDVFSVGATLFRILAGRAVHPGRNLVEALRRVATEAAPRLLTVAPDAPRELAAVVDAALAFEPARRYPDARAMQDDVRALRRGDPPTRALALEDVGAEAPTRAANLDTPAAEFRSAERLVGKTLQGGYVLGRLLGRGGMGAVFESTTPDGQPCAVKVILAHADTEGSNAEERFRREASLAAKILHPNVVRTFAVDVDKRAGHPYFVMERLEGRDLASWVRETGPLDGRAVARIFVQACRGVAAAHAIGIIHRDLKPANIMLSQEGPRLVAKICDFGLAKNTLGEPGEHGHSLTKSGGALLGTPQYTAPEQAMQAKNADSRSDVWGLCISMYEALSGRRPWAHCETLAQLLLAICTESIPPLTSVAPWVDPGLAAVVQRGLERDRELRFQSVDELVAALEPFTGGADVLDPTLMVEAHVTSQDLTRVMRAGAPEAPRPLPATSGVPTAKGVSTSVGASLDALASSGTRPPARTPWLVPAGAALLVAGMAAGWFAFRPAPSESSSTAAAPGTKALPIEATRPVDASTASVRASAASTASQAAGSPSTSASAPSPPPSTSAASSRPASPGLASAPAAPTTPRPVASAPAAATPAVPPPSTPPPGEPGVKFKSTW